MEFKKWLAESLLNYADSLPYKWRQMEPNALKRLMGQYVDVLGRSNSQDPHTLNTLLQLKELLPQWKADPRMRGSQLDMLDAIVTNEAPTTTSTPATASADPRP